MGLAAPKDRPIPDDMVQALSEIIQLRHVIALRDLRSEAADERSLRESAL